MTTANGLRVLVVEDHDFQRRTMARMLRSLGALEVVEAGDGKHALELIQGEQAVAVDLVVCDLNMPEMDGMEFIRHLGEAKHEVSVIISSAQDRALLNSVEKMTRGYGVRLLGVIEKPVTLGALEDLIARHKVPQPVRASSRAATFSIEQILHGVHQKQFEPFFQPKVELATGRAIGAEALARWRHPEHGLVGPYAFIAALEQSGKLDELTFLMLDRAADACHGWRQRGLELTVSVNLSIVSLSDTTLADRITQAVRSAGLEPTYMILEITETAAMTEVAPAWRISRACGCGVLVFRLTTTEPVFRAFAN